MDEEKGVYGCNLDLHPERTHAKLHDLFQSLSDSGTLSLRTLVEVHRAHTRSSNNDIIIIIIINPNRVSSNPLLASLSDT